MTTRAAIVRGPGQDWEVTEVQLDDPKPREVRIRVMATGLCHSDDHIRTGHAPVRFPMVGGHEGAGIVDAVGEDVSRVTVGDHVVCSFIPVCGTCRSCSTGHQNLCDSGLNASTGMFLDGTFRFHKDGEDLGGLCTLGTFADYAVVSENSCVPVDRSVPFEVEALLSCGVPTGWGSAVYAAGVRAGETVVVFGAGGVGSNAVQGARYAGAKNVIVVDPVPFKRDMAKVFGATHTFATAADAQAFVVETTWGRLADHAIITVGVLSDEVIGLAVEVVGKCGQVTITAVGPGRAMLPAGMLIGFQRRLRGAMFGSCNPLYDIPRLLGLYQAGDVKLDELITARYALAEINEGYAAMLAGKNVRAVVVHEH